MQVPILNGVYTGENADYRTSYPLNMMPVVQSTGVSEGYLRPVEGIVEIGDGFSVSRGAINWNGIHYRVLGEYLCSITEDGDVTQLGSVETDGERVSLTYSFDLLAIASNGGLFYYYPTTVDDSTWTFDLILELDGFKLVKVTDPDLGVVNDVIWIDGYFMTTDGEFIVVTDINDPTSVNPLKYGSSEIDPDPIIALEKIRNEVYVVNRYSVEIFTNVGGSGFPFQRINGAQIHRGAIGKECSAVMEETLVFLGSGLNESPAIYMGRNAQTTKISTREIEDLLKELTETELSAVVLEVLNKKSQIVLWVRLPDRTMVYSLTSSQQVGSPVWFTMSSGIDELTQYRARDAVYCYNKWQVGDSIASSGKIGVLDDTVSTHFGEKSVWEFGTQIVYNNSMGAIVHRLELVALTGRADTTLSPIITTSYSVDGRLWSQDRPIKAGMLGNRLKRLVWWRQGNMSHVRIQRFRGDSNAYITVARLEAEIEPLSR